MNTIPSKAERDKTLFHINFLIRTTEDELSNVQARLSKLKRDKEDIESINFIEDNNIKLADVEMSSGVDKPWFATAWKFGEWLKNYSTKEWAEWGGRIYHSKDLINMSMTEAKGVVRNLS